MDTAVVNSGSTDAKYWEALSEGRLVMQQCQGCARWKWPAVSRCGECGTWYPEWKEIPLSGVLYGWTRNWYPFAGTEGIGVPFVAVLAALPHADDKRLLGLYEGDESLIKIGLPLKGRVDRTIFGDLKIPSIRWSQA